MKQVTVRPKSDEDLVKEFEQARIRYVKTYVRGAKRLGQPLDIETVYQDLYALAQEIVTEGQNKVFDPVTNKTV